MILKVEGSQLVVNNYFGEKVPRRANILEGVTVTPKGKSDVIVEGVTQLRIGKSIELEIEASNKDDARSKIELMSDRLLSNPVIEDWTLEFKDEQKTLKN